MGTFVLHIGHLLCGMQLQLEGKKQADGEAAQARLSASGLVTDQVRSASPMQAFCCVPNCLADSSDQLPRSFWLVSHSLTYGRPH